jgi:membrane associated rhomboid family serine protease
MTSTIVVVTVAAFFAQMAFGGSLDPEMHLRMGSVRGDRVIEHRELYRLVTPMLLHAGPLHLALNLLALVQLGLLVETLWGSGRTLVFYVVSGVVASLASAALTVPGYSAPGGSVGASGAILGLAGVIVGASWYGAEPARTWLRTLLGSRLLSAVVLTFAIGIGLGLVAPVIDNRAHLGGFLTGLLLAAAHPDPNERQVGVARVGGALAGLAVLVSAGFAWVHGGRAVDTFALDAARSAAVQVSNHDFDNPWVLFEFEKLPGAAKLVAMLTWYERAGAPDEGLDVFLRQLERIRDPATLGMVAGLLQIDPPQSGQAVLGAAQRWVEIAPNDANALNTLAWTLVTVSDPLLRDPARADELSRKSLTHIPDPDSSAGRGMRAAVLDTLGEALFQLGRFEEASEVQRESVALARDLDLDAGQLAEIQDRLAKIEAAGRG